MNTPLGHSRQSYAQQAIRLWVRLNRPLTSRQLANLLGCSTWTARRTSLGFYIAGLLEPVDERRGHLSYRPTRHALSMWPRAER